eukprot:scaffold4195_cov250-Pinguiococcus_pyrenoidosus.AAC.3
MKEASAAGWMPEKNVPEKPATDQYEELDASLLKALQDVGPLEKTERSNQLPRPAPSESELPRSASSKPRTMPLDRSKVEPSSIDAIPAVPGRLTEAQAFGVFKAFRTTDPQELEAAIKEHSQKTGVPEEQLRVLQQYMQYPRIVVNNVDDKFAAYEPDPKPLKVK